MSRKPKFKPQLIRIRLNPEQAVLQCDCFSTGEVLVPGQGYDETFDPKGHTCGFEQFPKPNMYDVGVSAGQGTCAKPGGRSAQS